MNSTLNPNLKKQDREDVHSLGAERDDDSTPENTHRDEELRVSVLGDTQRVAGVTHAQSIP